MMEKAIKWRSRRSPGGVGYEVWLVLSGVLSDAELASWKAERERITESMREAGMRGARAKLKELQGEWGKRFVGLLSEVSQRRAKDAPLYTRANELAHALETAHGVDVLAWEIGVATARLLVEPAGEADLEVLVSEWEQALPNVEWEKSYRFIRAVSPREATEWMNTLPFDANEVASVGATNDAPSKPFHHLPVLFEETIVALEPSEGKTIIDATLGGGGHSEALLERGATVWGIDQDPEALAAASARLARFGTRFHAVRGNFRCLTELLCAQGVESADGILADIGVSSHQLDTAERGFSFREDGPLDMRMNPQASRSAADLVNEADEEQLAEWLWQYGEEKASRVIARAIVAARQKEPIVGTRQLAEIIESVLPRHGKQHPATRSFQALRIAVNDELGALSDLLEQSVRLLKPQGRLALITFHSLEDRIVKRFYERVVRPEIDRPEWPAPKENPEYCARLVYKKPLTASAEEQKMNPRSRSAKLRVLEKITLK